MGNSSAIFNSVASGVASSQGSASYASSASACAGAMQSGDSTQMGAAAGGAAGAYAGGAAGAAVGGYFGGPIGAAIGQQIGEQVGQQVGEKVGAQVGEKLGNVDASSITDGASSAKDIAGSMIGTSESVMNQAMGLGTDAATQALNSVADAASGVLGDVGGMNTPTMDVAGGLASGGMDTSGLAQNILGDTSQVLSDVAGGCCGGGGGGGGCCGGCCGGAAAAAQAAVNSACCCAPAVAEMAQNEMQMVTSAMDKGCATIATMDAVVGGCNGACDLLTSSLENNLDRQVANMMAQVIAAIQAAHGITHPLFVSMFQMTWSENKQWLPEGFDPMGDAIPGDYMTILKEIPEYFDFIQKIMCGAIAEVTKDFEQVFENACNCCGGMYNACMGATSAQLGGSCTVDMSAIKACLHVPMMSIGKQVEDLLNKFSVIKEIIRAKAREIVEKLKSMESPELYVSLPEEFRELMSVLMEAEFIMSNLPIAMDKIIEFIINIFVQQFTQIAEQIANTILGIFLKILQAAGQLLDVVKTITDTLGLTGIIPEPLGSIVDELLKFPDILWVIPNQADFFFNKALNIALPMVWDMAAPYIMAPYDCVATVAAMMDATNNISYSIPT